MQKDNLLEQARNINIEDILNYYSLSKNRYNMYSCIKHEDKHPSASVKNNKLHCFSCGNYFTTIDIVSQMESIGDIRECARRVLDISSNIYIDSVSVLNKDKINKSCNAKDLKKSEKKKLTANDRLNMMIDSNKHIVRDYLIKRGISNPDYVLSVLDRNGYKYGADSFKQVTFVFERYNCCIYRNKSVDENWVAGVNVPITIAVNKENKDWYITEGIYDALSLVSIGNNVICLNSTNNILTLKDLISNNIKKMKKFTYIIATDNDSSGVAAKEDLASFFDEHNLNYEYFGNLYNSDCKDVNELLLNNML